MYDMINIFEVFLPQLLRYPNPSDPLNGEAAAMLMREPKGYEAKVKGTSCFRGMAVTLPERLATTLSEKVIVPPDGLLM
jgi:hypothetical protein